MKKITTFAKNIRLMGKKEELTTAMHSEFLDGEISEFDMRVMGVVGATNRGVPITEALQKYEMTEEEFKANVKRVLSS